MLTAEPIGANAPRTVMSSIAEIARRDGVSKPTVSNKVKRLVEQHGLTVERDGQGRVAAVNVAEFDYLLNRYSDPSKAQAPARDEPVAPNNESYDEALRLKTWHEAERKRLELAQMAGELVRAAEIRDAIAASAVTIAQIVDRLPNAADDLAAAVAREGSHGLRVALKKLAVSMREEIARALDHESEQAEEQRAAA